MDISSFLNKKLNLPPVHISELSYIMLEKIIHQIHLGRKVKREITSKILGPNDFPKGVDFYHIVDEIRDDIENMSKMGKRYEFKIAGRLFVIYTVVPERTSGSLLETYRMLDAAVKKMYVWLFVAIHFCPTECSRSLTVYWYLTEHKKKLPYKAEPIDKENANTAFTSACPIAPNNIYIFRKEEWFKVFIHETFHSLGLDFAKMIEKPADDAIFAFFPVQCGELRFYETYTEMWAEIINVLFFCLGRRDSIPKKKIEAALQKERMFSLFQSVKILNHHSITYKKLLTKEGGSQYTESTHAFSYYILKSICMFFCSDFIEWCSRKNKGTIAFLKTQPNILSFVEFVKTKHNNPEYIGAMKILEDWFSTTNHKGPIMETMRMTIHG